MKLDKTKLGAKGKEGTSVNEVTYWGDLLRVLAREGVEDAREVVNDIQCLIQEYEKGEDPQVLGERLMAGLLRYGVLQTYRGPVTPGNDGNLNVRLPAELLQRIDTAVSEGKASSRSEFVRTVIELIFSAGDAADMGSLKFTEQALNFVKMLMETPERMMLFYLVQSFFDRPDVGVSKILISLVGPISQIISVVGGEGLQRVREQLDFMIEAKDGLESKAQEPEHVDRTQ